MKTMETFDRVALWRNAAVLFAFLVANLSCALHVRIGAEVLVGEHLDWLYGNRRVALVCNHTSVFPDGTHLADSLLGLGVNVTTLFGPEHGIRGASGAGESVLNGEDPQTHLPVISLYGKIDRPTDEMLKRIDLVIFDIQDVGARFYTYATTMALAMEAAGRNGKTFIVLDRPNPVNGVGVEGPILDTAYKSFIGRFPIPVRHGMTIGELALMIVGERWLGEEFSVDLRVVPMEGWNRAMWYEETGLGWISPSPNMKSESTAVVYPGTCLLEGTNVSEGRGTAKPFELIGAPWIDGERLSAEMEALKLDSVSFDAVSFTPQPDPVAAPSPKYSGKLCEGVFVRVRERNAFKPVETGFMLLEVLRRLYPDSLRIRNEMMDRLAGSGALRATILTGRSVHELLRASEEGCEEFRRLRSQYLMYE